MILDAPLVVRQRDAQGRFFAGPILIDHGDACQAENWVVAHYASLQSLSASAVTVRVWWYGWVGSAARQDRAGMPCLRTRVNEAGA